MCLICCFEAVLESFLDLEVSNLTLILVVNGGEPLVISYLTSW